VVASIFSQQFCFAAVFSLQVGLPSNIYG
jgi:hypothetical protein